MIHTDNNLINAIWFGRFVAAEWADLRILRLWRIEEWSPFQLGASSGSSPWAFKWVCLICSRTFRVEDVSPLPDLSCPHCQVDSGAVFDVTTGDVRRVCISCNCVVTVPDSPQQDWFSCGPLCGMSPLYGWDARTLSGPGEGTQYWLLCPLISLGMLQVGTTLNIPACTTGRRAPAPECQRQYWSRNAGELVDAYAAHSASLTCDDLLVAALTWSKSWGPSGDHLDARLEEQRTLAHILSLMEVWVSTQVAGSTIPPSAPMVVHASLHNASPASLAADNVGSPSRPLPSPSVRPRTSSSFHVPLQGSVVSNSFTTSLPTENNTVASNRGAHSLEPDQFASLGSWRCLAISTMPQWMLWSQQDASITLVKQTAWGVWLRTDHWRASRGASRLRCGVLDHPVNRELTFHGVASVVTQFLLPLCADWTFASTKLLPSIRPTNLHEPLDDPSVPENAFGRTSRRTLPVRPAPVPTLRSTPLPPRPPSPPPTLTPSILCSQGWSQSVRQDKCPSETLPAKSMVCGRNLRAIFPHTNSHKPLPVHPLPLSLLVFPTHLQAPCCTVGYWSARCTRPTSEVMEPVALIHNIIVRHFLDPILHRSPMSLWMEVRPLKLQCQLRLRALAVLGWLAGVLVARSLCILSAPRRIATCTAAATAAHSTSVRRETAARRRLYWRGRVNPTRFSSCAQPNTRRLWNADGTVHVAFRGLSDIL